MRMESCGVKFDGSKRLEPSQVNTDPRSGIAWLFRCEFVMYWNLYMIHLQFIFIYLLAFFPRLFKYLLIQLE